MAQQPPPTYVFTGDRRRIEPYVYAYTMHCKGRWCGRRPDEVFGTEFKMNPPSYYCLLYTSPSPRDGLLSRMPSSA